MSTTKDMAEVMDVGMSLEVGEMVSLPLRVSESSAVVARLGG